MQAVSFGFPNSVQDTGYQAPHTFECFFQKMTTIFEKKKNSDR